MKRSSKISLSLLSLLVVLCVLPPSPVAGQRATPQQLEALQKYIKDSWRTLARSHRELPVAAADPKFPVPEDQPLPVYISRRENVKKIQENLRRLLTEADLRKIEIRQLPREKLSLQQHGLLYLPHPYVVPGGRFNEMYGWDSYFTQVGLVRDGEIELAQNIVDNFLYQIEHYGKILNANRSYYLTRSQPPFLTQMVLIAYRRSKDKNWLRRSLPLIERYYQYWTTGDHLVSDTALSRYYDSGSGPAPEVVASERDESGKTHYDRVREYYRTHEITDYVVRDYYDAQTDRLTDLFYKGDRAMRESGFDPSNRFGPFSIDIISYNPVCLNSLLYMMERDTAEILRELSQPAKARAWSQRAVKRMAQINQLMWDEKDGLYYDYNFRKKSVRRYPFVTTFYPLWAGIASPAQARRVLNNLAKFERPGGLMTSTNETGSQWDAPFGWAPMQMIAVGGVRRYGYHEEADRISINFLSLILKEFIEHNVVVEKYDVVRRDSDLRDGLKFGYSSNEIGFGWTNAAFADLYALLPYNRTREVLNTAVK